MAWAQAEDNEAMAELFNRYRQPLTYLAVGIAGADGEDALMEVMCTFRRRIKTFDPQRGVFGVWIRKVVVNEARKHVNRRRRADETAGRAAGTGIGRQAVVSPSNGSLSFDIATVADDPEERTVNRDILHRFLESLSDREREVLISSAVAGLSDAEIAEVLDIEPTTVRTVRHKARAKLTRLITAAECGPPGGKWDVR